MSGCPRDAGILDPYARDRPAVLEILAAPLLTAATTISASQNDSEKRASALIARGPSWD